MGVTYYKTKEIAGLFITNTADFQKFDNNSGGDRINKKGKRASRDKGGKICTGCPNKLNNRMQEPQIDNQNWW